MRSRSTSTWARLGALYEEWVRQAPWSIQKASRFVLLMSIVLWAGIIALVYATYNFWSGFITLAKGLLS
jgi:hypothetical protein